ncbi:MAG: glycerophosphodiester phosphodiesterase family protein [Paludibacteraceae bacterium]|nr:glycerophosphodiester phosphodiesterase family protein [Paludibacteraceae bacterium]
MRKKTYIYIITLVLFFITTYQAFGQQKPQPIAHALGSIDGHVYTNSREAMVNSIEKGYKFIEVDIDSTSDGILIASHDWELFNEITDHNELKDSMASYEDFKQRKIYNTYTPITIQEVVDTLMNHPDISVMTDKISDPDIIDELFGKIKERVYVECFSEEDYFELKKRGYHVMFSTYTSITTLHYIIKNMMIGNGRIEFVTTSTDQDLKELRRLKCVMPLHVSMFTINTEEELEKHIDDIDFFYSDFYDPSAGTFNNPKE